jgi:hypothetical protein
MLLEWEGYRVDCAGNGEGRQAAQFVINDG